MANTLRTSVRVSSGRLLFRVFGCRAWVLNDSGTKTKLNPKSLPVIFVGYDISSRSFRLWNPATRSIVVSSNVRFSENQFPNHSATHPSAPFPDALVPPIASSSKAVLPHQTVKIPLVLLDEDPMPTIPVVSAPSSTLVSTHFHPTSLT